MEHTAISPEEAADRLAIRELVDAYAHCADRRDAEGQKALFTEDTHFLVYMNGVGTEPTEDLHGSEQLTPVFAALKQYEVTMHFNGQAPPGSTARRPPVRPTASPTTCSPQMASARSCSPISATSTPS
jgi:hypothetical protein